MQTVKRHSHSVGENSIWYIYLLPGETYPLDKFLIPSLDKQTNEDGTQHGHAAIEKDGIWKIVKVSIIIEPSRWLNYSQRITIRTEEQTGEADLAAPIDPRMIESDIEGARRIEPNADNTGWLFYHETLDDCHQLKFMVSAFPDPFSTSTVSTLSKTIHPPILNSLKRDTVSLPLSMVSLYKRFK